MAEEKSVIVGEVKKFKGSFYIFFPETPKKVMRDLRQGVSKFAKINRSADGGINIKPYDSRSAEEISELAFHIGDLGLGITVDANTIPIPAFAQG
ncbi:MAG: hypothetical protein QMD86_01470 [Patescibacteria group bacterium]|nr:hypothetical protein [Patescibacteria group bacterium]